MGELADDEVARAEVIEWASCKRCGELGDDCECPRSTGPSAGRWALGETVRNHLVYQHVYVQGTRKKICDVTLIAGESRFNGTLLVAAPEMLEALKEVEGEAEDAYSELQNGHDIEGRLREIVDICQVALSAAKGETPGK